MLEDRAAWLTGKGTVIAILDSGINMKHTAFQCAASKELKILPAPQYSRNFNQGWGSVDNITDRHDGGHGTLCAGIAAGFDYRDAYIMSNQGYIPIRKFPGGVAPQAQLIVCRIDIDENQIVQALDHLIKIQEEGLKKVDVVSMSFGLEKFNQQIEDRIKILTSKRTICVASELKILPAPQYSRNFNQGWGSVDNITDRHDGGHGTLCAGIAAGFDYRDAYIMSNQGYIPIRKFPGGVAPQAQLIVCRIDIDENQIVQALDHLIKIQEEGLKKVDVVSMSVGLENFNQQIEDRIKTLTSKRTICVASAGNDGQKYLNPITYPATSENVICVGASDSYGNRAPFSPVGLQMEFLAPGKSVLGPVTHTKECLGQSRRCTCGKSPNHTSQCAAIECSCGAAHTKALNCVTGTSYAAPACCSWPCLPLDTVCQNEM